MPILGSDIILRLTTSAGAAGDTNAQPNANASLGKYTSTTKVPFGTLFDDVTASENAAGTVNYRAIDVLNNHATLVLRGALVYLGYISSTANVALAVDNVGPVAKTASVQGSSIANETTTPAGVGAFSTPTDATTGLALGDLSPGQIRRVWIRRTAAGATATVDDSFTIYVVGDSDA
jgi:osmotically-inducible protein OsmY